MHGSKRQLLNEPPRERRRREARPERQQSGLKADRPMGLVDESPGRRTSPHGGGDVGRRQTDA